MIRTARRPVREGAGAVADLAAVAAERAGFWSALADDDGRPFDRVLPAGPVPVRATAEDLAAALDALLGNVFSHTPDGTAMRLSVVRYPDGTGAVSVEDAGDGPRLVRGTGRQHRRLDRARARHRPAHRRGVGRLDAPFPQPTRRRAGRADLRAARLTRSEQLPELRPRVKAGWRHFGKLWLILVWIRPSR